MLNQFHEDACESVDAAVFNGDILYTDLEGFIEYLDRWNRAVEEHKAGLCSACNGRGRVGGLTTQGYEEVPCPFCAEKCEHGVFTQYHCIECDGDPR